MDAYVIIGENDSGKSSVTRCLTGSGSGKIRTRPIAKGSDTTIDVYVHLSSLQEDYKRIKDPADFVRQVNQEECDAVLFSLWPHCRGGGNKRPDADAYLRHFVDVAGWKIVKVACLGDSASSINVVPKSVIDSFPKVTPPQAKPPMPANKVAARVREHFGWV
jgi:energy-coupling factor transporter ATP-binding protein EcfA2